VPLFLAATAGGGMRHRLGKMASPLLEEPLSGAAKSWRAVSVWAEMKATAAIYRAASLGKFFASRRALICENFSGISASRKTAYLPLYNG